MKTRILSLAAAGLLMTVGSVQAQSLTANVAVSNNYIWRGLTQSVNDPAVSGGLDWAADSGFYLGTWASNVSYTNEDNSLFNYEHDIYGGFSGEAGGLAYDVGYLYYNYDAQAEFDFSELYGSIGVGGFTFGAYILVDTEADEGPGQDFGFGEATYIYADYVMEVGNGVEVGFHVGRHEGDFNEAFNGVTGDYLDYNISIAKDGFSFMITDTDTGDEDSPAFLDNDEVKFVVSYSMDFEL
ncbi:MAG: TorF family putative porin [Gammaproteobacteria bacterium]